MRHQYQFQLGEFQSRIVLQRSRLCELESGAEIEVESDSPVSVGALSKFERKIQSDCYIVVGAIVVSSAARKTTLWSFASRTRWQPQDFKIFACRTWEGVREYNYIDAR